MKRSTVIDHSFSNSKFDPYNLRYDKTIREGMALLTTKFIQKQKFLKCIFIGILTGTNCWPEGQILDVGTGV